MKRFIASYGMPVHCISTGAAARLTQHADVWRKRVPASRCAGSPDEVVALG